MVSTNTVLHWLSMYWLSMSWLSTVHVLTVHVLAVHVLTIHVLTVHVLTVHVLTVHVLTVHCPCIDCPCIGLLGLCMQEGFTILCTLLAALWRGAVTMYACLHSIRDRKLFKTKLLYELPCMIINFFQLWDTDYLLIVIQI